MDRKSVCRLCGGTAEIDGVTTRCSMCNATINRGDTRIHVTGNNHEEVLKVTRELEASQQKNALLRILVFWSFIFGLALIGSGVYLAFIESGSVTELSFFGQTFKSSNVGISSIFIGSVLVVLNVRRILASHDKQRT